MDYPIKTLSQLRPILQGFRKAAGLTQAAMASHLGVTQQTYAQLEANPSTVSVERLFKVLRVLEVDLKLTQTSGDQSETTASTADEASLSRRRTKTAASITEDNATRKPQAVRKQAASPAKQTSTRTTAKPSKAPAGTAPRKTRGTASTAKSGTVGKKREEW